MKKIRLSLTLAITCFSLTINILHAQTLEEVIADIRVGNYFKGTAPFQQQIKNEPQPLLSEIIPYVNDTNKFVQLFVLDLAHDIGRLNENSLLRKQAVNQMVFVCSNSPSEVVERSTKYLQNYNRSDFSPEARDSLHNHLLSVPYYKDKLVLLVGYIGIEEAIPAIKALLNNTALNDQVKWNCHLALARIGDKKQVELLIRIMESKEINNAIIHNMVPGLIYTRQKEAFDYLVSIIQSDEKNCFSSNPDNYTQISCAYRVMEYIAPVIKNFPVEYYEYIRQLKTDNYKEALNTIRIWFSENPDYVIIDDSF